MIYDDLGVIVSAPSNFTVEHSHRPVLYLADGRVLVKRPAGFYTEPQKEEVTKK